MTFQVPVIAVFTKFDQLKRNVRMKLNEATRGPKTHIDREVERVFNQYYLAGLGVSESPPVVRLESENFFNQFTPISISVL